MRSNIAVLLGVAATAACTWLWHAPGGAGERVATTLDRETRIMLDYYEMPTITGVTQRDPVARRVILAGEANDFQRAELVRYTERLTAVGEARWSRAKSHFTYPVPLYLEALTLALAAFTAGLLITFGLFARRGDER